MESITLVFGENTRDLLEVVLVALLAIFCNLVCVLGTRGIYGILISESVDVSALSSNSFAFLVNDLIFNIGLLVVRACK